MSLSHELIDKTNFVKERQHFIAQLMILKWYTEEFPASFQCIQDSDYFILGPINSQSQERMAAIICVMLFLYG